MRYRLIGIDLDGTLLGPDGRVSAENRAAIARAHDAGVLVVPCTGRAWHESHRPLDDVEGLSVGVFVTGAIINEIATGRALNTQTIEPDDAMLLVERLRELPDAVLVFRERFAAGCDYLVTGQGELPANTMWWFEQTVAQVMQQPQVTTEDLTHALRVAVVSTQSDLDEWLQRISDEFGPRVGGHCFGGLVQSGSAPPVRILELFAPGVDKWRGMRWVAQQHGIAEHEIAVIGDEINDLPMLSAAGCGIAMGNAIEPARDCAHHITLTNCEHGVAHAIDQLLEGTWG